MSRGDQLAAAIAAQRLRCVEELPVIQDWSRVVAFGTRVPEMTTAFTYPGHEEDLYGQVLGAVKSGLAIG